LRLRIEGVQLEHVVIHTRKETVGQGFVLAPDGTVVELGIADRAVLDRMEAPDPGEVVLCSALEELAKDENPQLLERRRKPGFVVLRECRPLPGRHRIAAELYHIEMPELRRVIHRAAAGATRAGRGRGK